jgi:hypothetical protein
MQKETAIQPLQDENEELMAARARVRTLEDKLRPVVEMRRYDLWRGDLVVLKQKMHKLTGQSYVTKMRFEFTGRKPVRSATMPPKTAEFWNDTHWTARHQSTDLFFPEGVRYNIEWNFSEETEEWVKTETEFEAA